MIKQISLLSPFLLLPIYAQAATANTSSTCDPIGRIEAGTSDNYNQRGTVVCSGSEIRNPVDLTIWCFSNRSTVLLNGSTLVVDSDTCNQSAGSNSTTGSDSSICGDISSSLCFNPKAPGRAQFQVLEPNTVSGPRPGIEWETVPEAQSYTVYIIGSNVEWQRTTETDATNLAYPTDESPLTIGSAYEIVVTANINGEIAASAATVVNVTETTAQQINLQLATRTKGAQ